MIEQKKSKYLENTFLKLTETNQFFILGLVEGLKHSQGKKLQIKTSNNSVSVNSTYKNRSVEQKTSP